MASKKGAELELVGDKKDGTDQLPVGVTKEDLTKADPPKPIYVNEQTQLSLVRSFESLDLCQARLEAAVASLESARNYQQIVLRDTLEDMGVSRKTHSLARDEKGLFFLQKLSDK